MSLAPHRGVALLIAAALALGGCRSARPDPPLTAATRGTVEWAFGRGGGSAPVEFARNAAGDLRLTVGSKPPIVVERIRGVWRVPAVLADWQALAEAYEGAAHVPAGTTELRTARFSVRYERTDPTLRRLELVVTASGTRFRVTLPATSE